MNVKRAGAWLTAVAGGVAALLVSTAASAAAATPVDVSVTTGPVTLRPAADGGYAGSMTARLSYHGPDGAYLHVRIAAPEGLYLTGHSASGLFGCTYSDRYTEDCLLDGEAVNGRTWDLRLEFTALAAPQRRTRPTLAGSISASAAKWQEDLVESTPADNSARFGGRMVGTGGGVNPRPYRPANTYDLSARAAAPTISFAPDTRDGEGYVGSATLTLAAGTDAYHQGLAVQLLSQDLPGLEYIDISPTEVCFITGCVVPGGKLPEDRSRTVTLSVYTTELPAAGTVVQFRADTNIGGESATDAHPADNTVTLTVA